MQKNNKKLFYINDRSYKYNLLKAAVVNYCEIWQCQDITKYILHFKDKNMSEVKLCRNHYYSLIEKNW